MYMRAGRHTTLEGIVRELIVGFVALGSRMECRLRTEGRPQLRSNSIVIEFQDFADGRSLITNLMYGRSLVRGRKVASFYYSISLIGSHLSLK